VTPVPVTTPSTGASPGASGPQTCPLCGGTRIERVFFAHDLALRTSDHSFEVERCGACDVAFTRLPVGTELSQGYYEAAYEPARGPSPAGRFRELNFARIVARATGSVDYFEWCNPGLGLARFGGLDTGSRRLVEFGCGAGAMLKVLHDRGWDVLGVEPSAEDARKASSLGLDVREASADAIELPESSFDVVLMHHALEHVGNPSEVLAKSYRALRAGGSIVVAVPNFDSPCGRFFGPATISLNIPRHLFHFSYSALERLLTKAGFRVTLVAYDNSLVEVVASLRNLVLEKAARGRRGSHRRGTGPPLAAVEVRGPGLFLSIAYGPILSLLRRRAAVNMVVVAAKPRSTRE
jgi:SAM-dependent methyltransferase